MKSIKNYFIYFVKNHIFLFILFIISFFVASLAFSWFTVIFPMDWWFGFICYLPFIVVCIFSVLAVKIGSININKHLEKIIRIVIFCLNLLIIFIIQICIIFFFLMLETVFNEADMLNKVENYEENFSHFPSEMIKHFPEHIPQNAKNVQIYSDAITFQGSQVFVLKFDIDKEYTKKELHKHKFKYKETPDHYAFRVITNNNNINTNNFTFYVIDGSLNRHAQNHGIAVNKDFSQIIYYYSNPD